MDQIDKTIPTPLYYQLQQIIKEKIENGVWKPGDNIPTEQEMMEKYQISRSTVRQAVLSLVNDGYLRREKSKGTIVTSLTGRMHFVGSLISFSAEMNQKGISHDSSILAEEVIPATKEIAEKLQLSVGDEVYYLKRLRNVNDHPYLVDEHYIPYKLCPRIEEKYKDGASLYSLLVAEYNFDLHHGQIEFEPITASSKEVMDLLKIYSTTTLILAERIVYSEREAPMDYFKAYIHGKFSIDVLNSPEFYR